MSSNTPRPYASNSKMAAHKEKTPAVAAPMAFSLIISLPENDEKLPLVIESLIKIRPEHLKNIEIVAVAKDIRFFESQVSKSELLPEWVNQNKLKLISNPNQNAFLAGVEAASKKFTFLFNAQDITKAANLNELFTLKRPLNDNLFAVFFDFSSAKNKHFPTLSPFCLLNTALASYVLQHFPEKLDGPLFLYRLKKLGAQVSKQSLAQANPTSTEPTEKGFPIKCLQKIKNCFMWFFVLPFCEYKEKPHLKYDFIKENSLFRGVFSILAVLLFFSMTFLSRNAGMSGDEPVQYDYAQKVYKYYASFGKDTTALMIKNGDYMPYYGSSFDNLTAIYNHIFNVDKVYETRHFFNAITGWATLLFAGLLAVLIGGYRAGILTLLLMFLSPRFLGHSFNNPKDIPFALGYIMSVYFIARLIQKLPQIRWKDLLWVAIGIAAAISVRIGGLLLVAYLFLFVGSHYLISTRAKIFKSENILWFRKLIFSLIIVTIGGYLLGLILWPYALQSPFKHPFEALKLMENFATSLRQIFEGKIIWSDHAPWYYLPKYIAITIPLAVILGLALFILFFRQLIKKHSFIFLFILLFAFAFPILYIIYKHSNVYGGWRHVIFTYPTLVVACALGYNQIFVFFKNKMVRWAGVGLIAVLLFLPLKHIISNHPHEYVYYNELVGGVNKAFGFYETDYYYHGIREASEWLKKDLKLAEISKPAKKITIGSNHLQILNYYFRHDTDKVDFAYIRYFERGNVDWDYAVFVNSYMDPYQLQKGIWPPKNTIYQVKVDDKPICVVLKRNDKSDLLGMQYASRNSFDTAITYLNKAIADVPTNEAALLNLTEIYTKLQKNDTALSVVNQLLAIYPDYENGLNFQGWIYLAKNDPDNALKSFKRIIKVNFKFVFGYWGAAQAYIKKNDLNSAINYLKQAIEVNEGFKPAYQALAQIYQYQAQMKMQQGDKNGAQEMMNEAEKYAGVAKQL